ncbi:MAG: hypothetical protein IR158_12040 [Cellulomonas sp.]|uniref:hypothetical protein n=1 Tax=Cellulomonas sp. TaxID=40001 RepID=UPI0019EEB698|nr:hypothetical protein [Cellulomonas sp.]MBF0688479.1 hypothetical protein [Cellulomonas sp.]
MNRRPVILGTVVVLAVLGLAPAGAAAAAPAPPTRVSAITAEHDEMRLADSRWAHHTPPSTPIAATHLATSSDALRLTAPAGATAVSRFEIRASAGVPRLTVGRHAVGSTTSTVQLSLSDGTDCSAVGGEIDVVAVEHDDTGRITSLAAEYSVTCSTPLARSGSVRWNSTVPYAFTTTPVRVDPAPLPLGQTVRTSVDIVNSGTAPQTYGPSSFPWAVPADSPHVIENDGCAGTTLAPGGTCRIDLAFTPDEDRGVFLSYLETPDATPGRAVASTYIYLDAWQPAQPVLTATRARGGVVLTTTSDAPLFDVVRGSSTIASGVPLPWTDVSATPGQYYSYAVVARQHGATSRQSNRVQASAWPAAAGSQGEFVAMQPLRVLDTRTGTGARRGTVGPGDTVTLEPLAGTQVPAEGVTAVLLNVTGTGATTSTHVTAWPSGTAKPGTSSLNLAQGRTRANQVVVPVGDDGRVSLASYAGDVHLVVDVQGYFASASGAEGGGYHPTEPTRVLDTRRARDGGPAAPLAGGEVVWVPVAVPADAGVVTAVDVNMTVTQPLAGGHVTAWSGGGPAPVVSNANFAAGQTVANHAAVPVSYRSGVPGIAVRNGSGGTAHLVVDLQGWYDDGARTDGLRFEPSTPRRYLDTRYGPGSGPTPLPGTTLRVTGLPPAVAHVVNVTATGGSGSGHLTAWSGSGDLPPTSSVNFVAGENVANLAVVPTTSGEEIAVTVAYSATGVLVDHVGYYY